MRDIENMAITCHCQKCGYVYTIYPVGDTDCYPSRADFCEICEAPNPVQYDRYGRCLEKGEMV